LKGVRCQSQVKNAVSVLDRKCDINVTVRNDAEILNPANPY